MSAAQVTFVFALPEGSHPQLSNKLKGLNWKPLAYGLRFPEAAPMPEPANGGEQLHDFVHFLSMTISPADADDRRAWLLVEVTADGAATTLPRRLAAAMLDIWCGLAEVLGLRLSKETDVADWLQRHVARMGTALMSQPGLCFDGTPGMNVARIRGEAELAARIREWLRETPPRDSALGALEFLRTKVFDDAQLKWALVAEPSPLLQSRKPRSALGRVIWLTRAAWRDYLWILLPLPIMAALLAGLGFDQGALLSVLAGLVVLAGEVLVLGGLVAFFLRRLRAEEDADDPLDREPDPKDMEELLERENHRDVAQNHLAAQSRLKPGFLRHMLLRLALWTTAEITQLQSAPGKLDRIGTIHFARWYLLPGTDRLVFLSNYDGSWQSYLEDFIARLRRGLSSVWSNTRDFPKTRNLTEGGAGEGARFKRWARGQQLPTLAWFTAYPRLTAGSIRTNTAIRDGLNSAHSEEAAARWLSLLGHAPTEALDADQVQSIVLSGLSSLRFARAYVLRFNSTHSGQELVALCQPETSFGQQQGQSSALVLGFTRSGLHTLGLADETLKQFPTAFYQGMHSPVRARILGDFGTQADGPLPARWGMDDDSVHMVCVVYAESAMVLTQRCRELSSHWAERANVVRACRLGTLPKNFSELKEPFGFRDGISQPVIRGVRDWTAARHEQHLVNAGEFVLGYRDNLGQRAPTPSAGGMDFGRNGTFLVVRELIQDVAAFHQFAEVQARRLLGITQGVEHPLLQETQDWVRARMVGRWPDGQSLVRSPNPPQTAPGGKPYADNDFLFGREDPDGQRCPFGSHIRRANPRDSFEPGSRTQLAISNRHRILRRGRMLKRRQGSSGMLFMCLNGDIERQFEFLQQTWLLGANFHGLDNEVDPLLGPGGADQALSVPGPGGLRRLEPLARFVRTMGGGYFFVPGQGCLKHLAAMGHDGDVAS